MAHSDKCHHPVQLQKIIIPNNNGEKLVGKLHETGSMELVIICHGFRSSKALKKFFRVFLKKPCPPSASILSENSDRIPMVNLAAAFGNEGISAFRFDFAGNGESEGSFQYGNYRREADELRTVVQYFHGYKRLIAAIIGHSKGGNAVLLYSSRYNDVNTVVNISGRFDLEKGIEGRLGKDFLQRIKQNGFIDVKNRRGKIEYRVTEASLMDRLTTDMHAASQMIQQNCSVLTVHGSKDEIVPIQDAMEFAKYIANHRLHILEGADHEYTSHQDELASLVLDFVRPSNQDSFVPKQSSCTRAEKNVRSRI